MPSSTDRKAKNTAYTIIHEMKFGNDVTVCMTFLKKTLLDSVSISESIIGAGNVQSAIIFSTRVFLRTGKNSEPASKKRANCVRPVNFEAKMLTPGL